MNKILIKLHRLFIIVPIHKRMRKATILEYNELQDSLKSGDLRRIDESGIKWNLALLKFRQQHLGLFS